MLVINYFLNVQKSFRTLEITLQISKCNKKIVILGDLPKKKRKNVALDQKCSNFDFFPFSIFRRRILGKMLIFVTLQTF